MRFRNPGFSASAAARRVPPQERLLRYQAGGTYAAGGKGVNASKGPLRLLATHSACWLPATSRANEKGRPGAASPLGICQRIQGALTQLLRRFVGDAWPVRIGGLNIAGNVFQPPGLYVLVQVQIEGSIHNPERRRLNIELLAEADRSKELKKGVKLGGALSIGKAAAKDGSPGP